MDFYFFISRLLLIGIGVYLLAYRQIVRYHAEKIIFQVVETQKAWQSPVSWGFYRYFVTYEYDGCMYQQKALNLVSFGILLGKKFTTTQRGGEAGLVKSAAMISGMWNK